MSTPDPRAELRARIEAELPATEYGLEQAGQRDAVAVAVRAVGDEIDRLGAALDFAVKDRDAALEVARRRLSRAERAEAELAALRERAVSLPADWREQMWSSTADNDIEWCVALIESWSARSAGESGNNPPRCPWCLEGVESTTCVCGDNPGEAKPWMRDRSAADSDTDPLEEARSWARHGYEIAQRSCTWSDHGVAPKWLTGWHTQAAPTEEPGETPTNCLECGHLLASSHADNEWEAPGPGAPCQATDTTAPVHRRGLSGNYCRCPGFRPAPSPQENSEEPR